MYQVFLLQQDARSTMNFFENTVDESVWKEKCPFCGVYFDSTKLKDLGRRSVNNPANLKVIEKALGGRIIDKIRTSNVFCCRPCWLHFNKTANAVSKVERLRAAYTRDHPDAYNCLEVDRGNLAQTV